MCRCQPKLYRINVVERGGELGVCLTTEWHATGVSATASDKDGVFWGGGRRAAAGQPRIHPPPTTTHIHTHTLTQHTTHTHTTHAHTPFYTLSCTHSRKRTHTLLHTHSRSVSLSVTPPPAPGRQAAVQLPGAPRRGLPRVREPGDGGEGVHQEGRAHVPQRRMGVLPQQRAHQRETGQGGGGAGGGLGRGGAEPTSWARWGWGGVGVGWGRVRAFGVAGKRVGCMRGEMPAPNKRSQWKGVRGSLAELGLARSRRESPTCRTVPPHLHAPAHIYPPPAVPVIFATPRPCLPTVPCLPAGGVGRQQVGSVRHAQLRLQPLRRRLRHEPPGQDGGAAHGQPRLLHWHRRREAGAGGVSGGCGIL